MKIKNLLKKSSVLRKLNAEIKCIHKKKVYNDFCKKYKTPSILLCPQEIKNISRRLFLSSNTAPSKSTPKSIKVLFVGTDWEQDRSGIIQGLQNCAETKIFNHKPGHPGQKWPDNLKGSDAVRRFNGDVLVATAQKMLANDGLDLVIGQMWGISMHPEALSTLKRLGIKIVNISMDDRHAFRGLRIERGSWGGTLSLVPYIDLACTDAAECVYWYEKEGCKAIFFPEASDPELFRPLPVPKNYDVSFVGANYGIRSNMVRALESEGIKVQVYGKGWPRGRISTEKVPELFARSKIILGCGTVGHCKDFMALKLRDFDGPMSGSLYLTHNNPDLFCLYEINKEIILFDNIKDMVKKVKYYLNYNDERERIAHRGRLRAMNCHTWKSRFQYLLREVF